MNLENIRAEETPCECFDAPGQWPVSWKTLGGVLSVSMSVERNDPPVARILLFQPAVESRNGTKRGTRFVLNKSEAVARMKKPGDTEALSKSVALVHGKELRKKAPKILLTGGRVERLLNQCESAWCIKFSSVSSAHCSLI